MSIIPKSRPALKESQVRALLKSQGVTSPVAIVGVRGYYSNTFAPAGNSSRFGMTLFAQRDYIKPMLKIIAQMMMILGGGLATFATQKCADVRQLALSNGVIDFGARFISVWVKRAKSPHLFYAVLLVVSLGYFGIIGAIAFINFAVGFGVSLAPIQNSLLVLFFVALIIIAACLKSLFFVFCNISLRGGPMALFAPN